MSDAEAELLAHLPEPAAAKLALLIERRDELHEAAMLAADSVKVREDRIREAHQDLIRRRAGDPVIVVSGSSRTEHHRPPDEAAELRLEERIRQEGEALAQRRQLCAE